jgi:hypothetical protein
MLSHLFRMAADFQRLHGLAPNLLYLNERHLAQLDEALPEWRANSEQLRRYLAMDIVVDNELAHPRVAWSPVRAGCGRERAARPGRA